MPAMSYRKGESSMTAWHHTRAVLFAVGLVASYLVSAVANASNIVVVDFRDVHPPGGIVFGNITSGGFRFSPDCHIDVAGSIGWDYSGCPPMNPEWIGTHPSETLVIDYFGRPFSALSFDFYANTVHPMTIRSSKGASVTLCLDATLCPYDPYEFQTQVLGGPGWTGIKRMTFSYNGDGAYEYEFTNFVFRTPVPEPGTLALLGLGLAGLGVSWRRKA